MVKLTTLKCDNTMTCHHRTHYCHASPSYCRASLSYRTVELLHRSVMLHRRLSRFKYHRTVDITIGLDNRALIAVQSVKRHHLTIVISRFLLGENALILTEHHNNVTIGRQVVLLGWLFPLVFMITIRHINVPYRYPVRFTF